MFFKKLDLTIKHINFKMELCIFDFITVIIIA